MYFPDFHGINLNGFFPIFKNVSQNILSMSGLTKKTNFLGIEQELREEIENKGPYLWT